MPKYLIEELRHERIWYEVDADSPEEAEEVFHRGDVDEAGSKLHYCEVATTLMDEEE